MHRLSTPAAALASGLLLWLASPAVGWGWLAWIALVPAGAAAFARSRWALPLALGVALELTVIQALPLGIAEDQWAGHPVVPVLVGDSPVVVAALVAVPLAVGVLGLLRFPLLGTRSVLVGASAWTALDLLRTKLDPSGLFGPLYLSQHDTAAGAIAALGGPWLVTFALVAAGLALARLPGAPLPAAGALGLVAVVAALAAVADPDPGPPSRTVAAVQPGYDTAEYDRPLLRFHRERRYARSAAVLVDDLAPLTLAAARGGAALVVWPEAVVWVPPDDVRALSRLAGEAGATLVVPFFLPGPDHGGAVLVRPDGSVSRAEPKHRPMWFVGERGDNRDGDPRPIGVAGTLLGVDTQDAAVARALARAGARLLTSSTHDWEELAPHHRAFVRLAGTAVGRPVVHADWRTGSAIYGLDGVEADAGTATRRTVLVAEVGGPDDTPYLHVGDLAGWAAVAAAGVALVRRRSSAG